MSGDKERVCRPAAFCGRTTVGAFTVGAEIAAVAIPCRAPKAANEPVVATTNVLICRGCVDNPEGIHVEVK